MVTGVPSLDLLKAGLARVATHTTAFAGTVFRSCAPKYANETDLLTGEGSRRSGGRWNPIGIATVYGSLTPETAMAETLAHHRYYGIPLQEAMPRTFVAIAVSLQSVLDFRDRVVRERSRFSMDQFLAVDWRRAVQSGHEPITQTLGRAAFEVGLEGLILPSAADLTGANLLVFPKNLEAGSGLRGLNL